MIYRYRQRGVAEGLTWSIEPVCYLRDLFTAEDARGRGVGRTLIEAVYERARAAGITHVYWQTHESDAVARTLYDRLAHRSGFIVYERTFRPRVFRRGRAV